MFCSRKVTDPPDARVKSESFSQNEKRTDPFTLCSVSPKNNGIPAAAVQLRFSSRWVSIKTPPAAETIISYWLLRRLRGRE